jgi:hypothetical protein
VRSLLLLLLVPIAAGCARREPAERLDPGQVRLSTDRVLRTGPVGEGRWETRATFVLIDAENRSASDLLVTLEGTLQDGAGAAVGRLRAESLWVPRGGRRTFALVDAEHQERPTATGAQVTVAGAMVPRWAPRVRIHDAHIFDDRGRVMIAARVTNDADRPGAQIVFAAFHDAEGRPMARPHEVLQLGAGISRVVRFVGPEGSRTGYLFLGDATF